jgi:squalene cyclase
MIASAIDRGVGWLLDRREDGLWRDYTGSNVWVSAFIAASIGAIPTAREAARAVVTRLVEGRRPGGGWGYDEALLEDADSTAWVLLAARATGTPLPREVVIPALRFLLRHQDASGGFVTYGPEGVELFAGVPGRDGWFTPQPCVTAAALSALATYATPDLPALAGAADYLERAASEDAWSAYWWYGPTYGTYHAVRALGQVGRLSPDRATAIAGALLRACNPDGGWDGKRSGHSLSFTTSLALRTLLALGAKAPLAADLLLSRQRADGSFEASAELHVPGGNADGTMTMLDHGPFTTACALAALHALENARVDHG